MSDSYKSLLELATSRHSCRKFSSESVSEDDIQKILEVAKHSPFASGRSNWKVAVIRDRETLESLERTVAESSSELASSMDQDAASFFLRYSTSFTFFSKAGALLVPYCRETGTMKSMLRDNITPEIAGWEHDNLTKSLSCISMLILLAAESLGLGACYMTGPLVAGSKLNAALGLRDNFIIGALIPVGHKSESDAD